MPSRTSALALACAAVGLAASASPALALPGSDAAAVGSAMPDALSAVELVRSGELRRACEVTAGGVAAIATDSPATDERQRRLGLVHAVARAARFLDERGDETDLRELLDGASRRARPEDLPLLRALERASPRAAPFARSLARRALDRIGADMDARVLVELVRSDDVLAKRRALQSLGERLARIHAKVDAGHDLDAREQAEVSDPTLVAALVDALEERRPELDVLPHDLAATASPSALHDLALVETPAVHALETAQREGIPGAAAALAAALETAQARLRRFPRSSWSSASGAAPARVPGAAECAKCHRPLPSGSRYCPGCGEAAPQAACARCGGPLAQGVCTRCGGGSEGEPGRCERCKEPIGAQDEYCRACGIKRPR